MMLFCWHIQGLLHVPAAIRIYIEVASSLRLHCLSASRRQSLWWLVLQWLLKRSVILLRLVALLIGLTISLIIVPCNWSQKMGEFIAKLKGD